MSTNNHNPNPNPNTWSEASSSSTNSGSYDSDESEALSIKAQLLQAELALKEQRLRQLEAEFETYRLEHRISNVRTGGEHVLIGDGEGNAVPLNHRDAPKHIGVVPAPISRGAQVINLKVDFRLSPDERAWFTARFPGVILHEPYFGSHDHPRAHLETMLAARRAQAKLQPGDQCLDLFGNPGSNEGFNKDQARKVLPKHIDTLVNVFTEKDEYRKATKWGPPMDANGDPRWIEGTLAQVSKHPEFFARYDKFLAVHTLYYMTVEEIAELLNVEGKGDKRTILTAVVHRHKKTDNGTLFEGELAYRNDGNILVQTAVETGCTYTHPSIDWVWDNTQKVKRAVLHDGRKVAFTWDLEKFTADTWIVQFTACSALDDEGVNNRVGRSGEGGSSTIADWKRAFNAANDYFDTGVGRHVNKPTEIKIQGGDVQRVGNLLLFAVPGEERNLEVSNEPFLDHLRHQIAGKPRDAKNLASLYAVARRDCAGSSYPGTHKFPVKPGEISDHVTVAFLADLDKENTNLACLALKSYDMRQHQHVTSGFDRATKPTASFGTARGSAAAIAGGLRLFGKNKLADKVNEFS